ncbi:MAG: tetratricopeptide repeat protein [Vitreimonas sp.]
MGWRLAGAGLALLVLAACDRQQLGQQGDPLAQARQACADEGAEAEARMEACSTLIESGELSSADRAAALSNRGAATYEAGDVTGALRDFRAALDADENAMLAVKGRATILVESGQLDAAEPLVRRLVESGEYEAEAHYLTGVIAQQRGDIEGAMQAFDASIAADRRFAPAYAQRAAIKQKRENYAGAMADYYEAIEINPQLAPARAGRCWTSVLMEDSNMRRAREDADAAVEADPRHIQGQLCRGLLQLRAGEWADARTSYEAALEVEPGNPNALFGRGVARRRGGDNDGTEDMNRARDFDEHVTGRFEEQGVRTY